MENRFADKLSHSPAIKEIEIPDAYPSRRFAASFMAPAYTPVIMQLTALETQYEQTLRQMHKCNRPDLEGGLKLVEIEQVLKERYKTLLNECGMDNAEEEAEKMVQNVDLLARQKVKASASRG